MQSLRNIIDKARRAVLRKGAYTQDVDDLVQEAFLRVHEYEQRQEVRSKEAMVVTAAVNLSLDKARRRKYSPFVDVSADTVAATDDAPQAEDILQARARLQRAADGLDRLPERTRRILLARRLEGKSFQEIADAEGMTAAAVQKQIVRATMELKRWMDAW